MTDAWLRELERHALAARRLEGWQLEFEAEPLEPGPPWDYEARAAELCAGVRAVLDLGTGGGEVFARVLRGSRGRAFATEAWSRNAPVAARALRGRARVVHTGSLSLPFASDGLDLVLSRHEELCPAEVARVLRARGRLLTQQFSPHSWRELRDVFPDCLEQPDIFADYRSGLESAGLVVAEAREFHRTVRFRELGHLVYHLCLAPWLLPGFGVESHREGLAELERRRELDGGVLLTEGFFLIEARAGAVETRPSGR